MYKDKKIAVIVPAYNEENLIGRVIETMPSFIDYIIIVDDASTDKTYEKALSYLDNIVQNLVLIKHEENEGVGGAIISGHKKALDIGMDVMAVMAGDAQMDPSDLESVLDPIVSRDFDFSKGNRFMGGEAWKRMPKVRFIANIGLSLLNKISSGYWHISDPQCGYTAISAEALRKLPLEKINKGYHFENSMLIHLNIYHCSVVDVPVKAVYGIGEKSGINEFRALFSFSWYLLIMFFWRIKEKYICRGLFSAPT